MGSSGSALYTEAGEYEASLPGRVRLLPTDDLPFRARLTWMELEHVHLLNARETVSRIAYIALPAERSCAIFPARHGPGLICGGAELRTGDIVFHQPGARFHQRSTGATEWGSVAITSTTLRGYGSILTGLAVTPLACAQILRPPKAEWRRLLRVHAEASRIAETRLSHVGHPQVVRAVEQELIWALVSCLATAEMRKPSAMARRDAAALVRFEEALASRADQPVVADLCTEIGVSERRLSAACTRLLGMTPARYLGLRQFRRVATTRRRRNASTEAAAR